MKVKLLVQQIMAPELSPYGYQFRTLGRNNFAFMRGDEKRAIIIENDKYPPYKLRFIYQVRPVHLEFELARLYPTVCPSSVLSYGSDEEFINYLRMVACDTVNFIIPYMDAMEQNCVFSTRELSLCLSDNAIGRARRFSNKWGISMLPCRINLSQLDKIMDGMKIDVTHRKEEFLNNKNEILDLAAYFGELISISKGLPHQWEWRKGDSPEFDRFVITASQYDPLERVIQAWNCGTEIKNYSLKFFPMRERK